MLARTVVLRQPSGTDTGDVITGQLDKQVGHELGISEITVKAHRGRAMRKMHAQSLAHLITLATAQPRNYWRLDGAAPFPAVLR